MAKANLAQKLQTVLLESQPDLRADGALPLKAVVSWQRVAEEIKVLSIFESDVWIGPKAGALFATSESSRRIDFRSIPEEFRNAAKLSLYAAMRHPLRINKPPSFATLIKKWQALERYIKYLVSKGIATVGATTVQDTVLFLTEMTKTARHVETVVGQIATLREINVNSGQKRLSFSVPMPPYSKGSGVIARALWRKVHGKDFDDQAGHQPFEDSDAEMIVRSALFYLDTLSAPILEAFTGCTQIAIEYPDRRFDRSQEGRCSRSQKKHIASVCFPAPDCSYYNWPPQNFRQTRTHLRMLSSACAIVILFGLGCRRTELLSLKTDCLVEKDGEWHIRIVYHKGEDDLEEGRPVILPAAQEIIQAVEIQRSIARLLAENIHGFEGHRVEHDFLFALIRDRFFYDPDQSSDLADSDDYRSSMAAAQDESEEPIGREGGPMTLAALNGLLRDFKKNVTPDVDGAIAPHRFRKTVGRLVTLCMEGAPLILQLIYGHDHYRVTLKYMFASPFIQDEIVEQYPELVSRNLGEIYRSRDDLGGHGGELLMNAMKTFRAGRSPVQTAPEGELSEEEFVEIGLEMVEAGYMMLSVLARGMYCFKPVDAVGSCGKEMGSNLPNPGRCVSKCAHNIQLNDRRARTERTINWLAKKLDSPSLSPSLQKFYAAQLEDFRRTFGAQTA